MNARERRNLKRTLMRTKCRQCRAYELGMHGGEPMCFHCGASGSEAWSGWRYFPHRRENEPEVRQEGAKGGR